MTVPSEIHLQVSFSENSSLTMAEVKLVVSRVHLYSGVEEVTHRLSFSRPTRDLCLRGAVQLAVSSTLARVRHPVAEDVVFWTNTISSYVYCKATAADQSGYSSLTVLAKIKIFDAQRLSRVVQPIALVPLLYFQESELIGRLLLLPPSAGEIRRVPPQRRSSPIDTLVRFIYNGGDGSETTTNCVICLDNFEQGSKLTKTPCSHVFHELCLEQWLRRMRTCPLCRSSLPAETERVRL